MKKRTISFGKIDYNRTGRKINEVELDLYLKEDSKGRPVISVICGVWNKNKTDYILCGQCLDEVEAHENKKLYNEIREIWKTWHLNDTKCGSPEQYQILSEHFQDSRRRDYEKEVEYLKKAGKYKVQFNGQDIEWGKHCYWEIPDKILKRYTEIIDTGK